jgi:hypothetical protein
MLFGQTGSPKISVVEENALMTKTYSRSSGSRRYRPLDYSRPSAALEGAQAALGAALFFGALYGWFTLSGFLPRECVRPWVLLGLFALLLTAVDALARARWGWYRVRLGLVLALCAVAGFWMVRLGLWWVGRS